MTNLDDNKLRALAAANPRGTCLTIDEIAAAIGCTRGGVWMIQQRALHKLKRRLYLRNDPQLAELVDQALNRS